MHTFLVVYHAEELDLAALDVTLFRIEDQASVSCDAHKLVHVLVVLLFSGTKHDDIVSDPKSAWALAQDLIHPLLEDILGDVQAEGQPSEAISSAGAVECCQVAGLLVEGY